jgi:hypothetical protein
MGIFDFFKSSWKKEYDKLNDNNIDTEIADLNKLKDDFDGTTKNLNELNKKINEKGGLSLFDERIQYLRALRRKGPEVKKGGASRKQKSSNKRTTIKKK